LPARRQRGRVGCTGQQAGSLKPKAGAGAVRGKWSWLLQSDAGGEEVQAWCRGRTCGAAL
jgi:hypothetical protein